MPKTDENFKLAEEWNNTVYANCMDFQKKKGFDSIHRET